MGASRNRRQNGMADTRVREQVARLAAQLMMERNASACASARHEAARRFGLDPRFRTDDLPSDREIRDRLRDLARLLEGDARAGKLKALRLAALGFMRRLHRFHPALTGPALTGHVRKGSAIDLHVFADQAGAVTLALDGLGLSCEAGCPRTPRHDAGERLTRIRVAGRFPVELTVHPLRKRGAVLAGPVSGRAAERATLPELERLIRAEHPDADLETEAEVLDEPVDPYDLYRLLLAPLERVKQDPRTHPEGDALYHSLQVFERAREARPWDEELLLAALLHDVGKGLDPADHVRAGLQALEGALTPRAAFLIAHHMDAQALREGTLGHRAACRLRASEDFDDLMLLRDCDDRGRVSGADVCTLDEALDCLRALEQDNEGDGSPDMRASERH